MASLLDLAERRGHIGIEATIYTLKAVVACNPARMPRLTTLMRARKTEPIGPVAMDDRADAMLRYAAELTGFAKAKSQPLCPHE